jgi:hypothetical protein
MVESVRIDHFIGFACVPVREAGSSVFAVVKVAVVFKLKPGELESFQEVRYPFFLRLHLNYTPSMAHY